MPADEVPDPVDVCLFRSYAVVAISDAFPELVKQPSRLQGRQIAGFSGLVSTVHKYSIGLPFGFATGIAGYLLAMLFSRSPC